MEGQLTDVKFIDATDWTPLPWFNSGGTRAKMVLQSDDGNEYYFKCSEKKEARPGKPAKYYKYEFWSEIIAYQLGRAMGLDILRYDVAIIEDKIGCLSPKMNRSDSEQLIEVGRYMTALNTEFLPDDNSTRNEYTFQLLEKTIDTFDLSEFRYCFFQTILFDAIIGNTDRHQENWAFLGKTTFITETFEGIEKIAKENEFNKLPWIVRKIFGIFLNKSKCDLNEEAKHTKLVSTSIIKMAPIYDSGSSMGRELTEERIVLLLENENEFNKYISNGKSEIHWDKKKINHFEFIEKLLQSNYLDEIQKAASFLNTINEKSIEKLITNIDKNVQENWNEYCIPNKRKELIIKLLTLRLQKLKVLIYG